MIEVTTYGGNDVAYDTAEAETPEAALYAARVLLDELPAIQGVVRGAYVMFEWRRLGPRRQLRVDGEVIRRCTREVVLRERRSES